MSTQIFFIRLVIIRVSVGIIFRYINVIIIVYNHLLIYNIHYNNVRFVCHFIPIETECEFSTCVYALLNDHLNYSYFDSKTHWAYAEKINSFTVTVASW